MASLLASVLQSALASRLERYMSLRPSDLNLSWGGDVVLRNLELKMDALQQDLLGGAAWPLTGTLGLQAPRGRVGVVTVIVPWASLTSEPVSITLDDVVLEMDNHATTESCGSIDTDDVQTEPATPEKAGASPRVLTQPAHSTSAPSASPPSSSPEASSSTHGPGFFQSFLNSVTFNVHVTVNNMSLVLHLPLATLTISAQSIDVFSTDSAWRPSFAHVEAPSFLLHKICRIDGIYVEMSTDDRCDAILSDVDIELRARLTFPSASATAPNTTLLHVHCPVLDLKLSDQNITRIINMLLQASSASELRTPVTTASPIEAPLGEVTQSSSSLTSISYVMSLFGSASATPSSKLDAPVSLFSLSAYLGCLSITIWDDVGIVGIMSFFDIKARALLSSDVSVRCSCRAIIGQLFDDRVSRMLGVFQVGHTPFNSTDSLLEDSFFPHVPASHDGFV